MCGIAGMLGPAAHPSRIEAMLARLQHRGPDGQGQWHAPHVALGHTRLAIVDTSEAGRQPMHLGPLHAVVNGEIYNYPELRRDLEVRFGAVFASHCDSEVVLHGYAHEGEAFFARMNGMFAVALYDETTAQLLLVRDTMGIKPLYYCQHQGNLYFASEIKALFAAMPVTSWPIDRQGLAEYLCYQTALAGRTLFQHVALVRPGQILAADVTDPSTLRERSVPVQPRAIVAPSDFTKAVQDFTDVFEASVQRHLLSDVPIASYLSAGIDSACVTAVAAEHSAAPMHAFTGRFPASNGWYDETTAAAQAVQHLKGQHHVVDIHPQDLETALDAVIDALDEPKMGMGAFSQYMVAKAVARQFKVVLTGHGGDELFAGYPLFKLTRLASILRLRRSELPHLVYFALSALRRWFQPEYGRYLAVLWSQRAQRALFGQALVPSPQASLVQLHAGQRSFAGRMQASYLHEYLPNLLVVEDKISMAHQLESRTPWLDQAMLALSQATPMRHKLHGGVLKAIPKAYAPKMLPESYLRQPKRGFPTPLRQWLRSPENHLLESRLVQPDSALHALIAPATLAKEVARFRRSWYRHIRPLDEIQSHRMWQLLSLESWLRQWQQRYGIRLVLPS